jgi:MFS transporter, FHS family, L-fucose permease
LTHMPDIHGGHANENGESQDRTSDGIVQGNHIVGITKNLLAHRHFVCNVFAQFFYVGAQVGIGAFFINYVTEHWHGLSSQQGAFLLSLSMLVFMVGRFVSTWLMRYASPSLLLSLYALISALLGVLVVVGAGLISVIALITTFFFMSMMFPTIFALGVKNLGPYTKQGSSILVMSMVGGAIIPYLMGLTADYTETSFAYLLPLICFVAIFCLSRMKESKIIN